MDSEEIQGPLWVIGTVTLASRKNVLGLGRVIAIASMLLAAGIAIFAMSRYLPLSLAALVLAGYGAATVVASSNTILQTIIEEDKRGRVMSFFAMSFMGMAPFGSFLAGTLAGIIGPRESLLLGAACCLTGAVIFALHLKKFREMVRPIYKHMGIIKEVAEGMETSAEKPPLRKS